MQDGKRFIPVDVHLAGGILDTAGFGYFPDDLSYFVVFLVMVFDQVDHLPARGPGQMIKRIDQREGQLLFLDIVSGRFADGVAAVVEQVILYLESNPDFFAKLSSVARLVPHPGW